MLLAAFWGPPLQPHSIGDTDTGPCHCWHWSSHQGAGKVALQWEWAAPSVGVQLPPCSVSHCALGCALSSPKHRGRHGSSLAHGPQAGQGCSTAGAQERRDSGIRKEGGLDKDNAQLHQAGAPTALAASLCQWRDLGFILHCMGLLHPSSSLHLNPFNVASTL